MKVYMDKVLKRILPALAVVFLASACGAPQHKTDFDAAMKENRIADAYGIIKKVCAETPKDSICKEQATVTSAYARETLAVVVAEVKGAKKPMTLEKIESFKAGVSRVKAIDPVVDTGSLERELAMEADATGSAVMTLLKKAAALAATGDVRGAFDSYRAAVVFDGSVSEAFEKFKGGAVKDAYDAGGAAAASSDWKAAHKAFGDAAYLDSSYKDVSKQLNEAATRDTYEYHVTEGKSAVAVEEYSMAIALYEKAASYNNTDDLKRLVRTAKVGAANAYFATGVEFFENGNVLSGGVNFLSAVAYYRDLSRKARKSVKVPSRDLTDLLDELNFKGNEALDRGDKVFAFLYFKVLSEIKSDYPDAVSSRERLSAEMGKGAKNTLAVIPFGGPSYHVDAGNLMTSRILNFLYKNLAKDIRILERGAMEALMKESEVKTMQSGQLDQGVLSILNADFLLVGNVDDYKVESQVEPSHKTKRAKTGTKSMPNPAHVEWSRKKKGFEPPRFLMEPVYETVKYNVTYHKKSVSITVGYRIVDASGDVVHTNIVEKKKVMEGESNDGVELGDFSIPARRANVPSDGELLKMAEVEAIAELGADLTRIFADPEVKLLAEAKILAERGDVKRALRNMTRAIFIAEKKGKDVRAIEKELYRMIGKGGI